MEIIVCALKDEIKPLIRHFRDRCKFVVCGVKASKNLDFFEDLGPQDHVTNIGICAGQELGEIFQADKISGKRDYYPDLITTSIKTKDLNTIEELASTQMVQENPDLIFDQEAALIFEKAQKHIAPHQISFLKIVSDTGIDNIKDFKENINKLITNKLPEIESFINKTHKALETFNKNNNAYIKAAQTSLFKYSTALKCSKSMENRLKQQLRFAEICNINYKKFFYELKINGKIPVEHKKDGIAVLNDFDVFLIGD